MTTFRFHARTTRMMLSMTLLISCMALVGGISSSQNDMRLDTGVHTEEEACPPCEILFRNLEKSATTGKLSQVARVQERGEPKSGTGVMFDWASGTLIRTCAYLQHFFGESSCRVHFSRREENDGQSPERFADRTMIFNPALGGSDAKCTCESIESVTILLSRVDKHTLPVSTDCAYSHNHGIELAPDPSNKRGHGHSACKFADGTPLTNHADIWRCMHEANCHTTDDWLQMVVFRDPRPAVVSAYFHLGVHSDMELGDLEAFIARELPIMCQWLALRYILFSGLLPHQSVEFWYQDAMIDPLEWHYSWFDSIGIHLPFDVVEATAQAAAEDNLGFGHKKIDLHPGEEARRVASKVRRFEDEVDPEVLEIADAVLRVWLPPVLLEKLGVAP